MTGGIDVTGSPAPSVTPWAERTDEIAQRLNTDPERGLDDAEVARRRRTSGRNELPPVPPTPIWQRIGRQFTDPLVLLLLVAIVVATAAWWWDGHAGAPVEPIVIAAIVVLNATIGIWQEARAERAVAALRRLTVAGATVVRAGRTVAVSAADLVPGDLLVLAAGDSVGADARLLTVAALSTSEGALTGESEPVTKTTDAVPAEGTIAERTNMVFQGTAVARGRGTAVVTATGTSTEIGRIARLLDETEDEPTPLEAQIRWLGRVLGATVVVLASLVFAVILVMTERRDLGAVIDAALVGVSLAVAAVPEGLPAILSIVLAIGVRRMAADRAIVKHLSSVETLGSASVICTDKTGTLTRNEMTLVTAVVPSGRIDIGTTAPPGAGPSVVERPVAPVDHEFELLLTAATCASDATVAVAPDGSADVTGDPTEVALVLAATRFGAPSSATAGWERVDEAPFDSDRKMMSTTYRTGGFAAPDERFVLFVKGAPDVVVGRCAEVRRDGRNHRLTDDERATWLSTVDDLADEALRTLAVAYRPLARSGDRTEDDLVLLGLAGIADPPRPDVAGAIAEAQRGGIDVVMVTGDHPRTASRIARELDITDSERVLSGRELAGMDDDALADAATATRVVARVDPVDKLRLVRALQAAGHVTAMTGDGVNDGPALRQADIGVAMGRGGTEVAREAADMVLADDHFATIVRAVREGREIYADIKKFLRYLLASNTGEVLVVLFGVVFAAALGLTGGDDLAVPLLATQILWINLVTDGALALALGVDPSVEDVMAAPPRARSARVIDRDVLRTIVVVGVTTAIASLVALDLELAGGLLGGDGDLESARTMTFTTLVLAQVGNAFTSRSDRASAFTHLFTNRMLWLAAVGTIGAQVAVVHVPGLNTAFDATPLRASQWATCAALASSVLVVVELSKLRLRRGSRTSRSALVGPSPRRDDGIGSNGRRRS